MAAPKDDASTDIEMRVKAFANDMTEACAMLREARIKKNEALVPDAKDKAVKPPPVVSFCIESNAITRSRTPAEQAAKVSDRKSWVCWGSHMTDRARHVLMKVDGKLGWDSKKVLEEDFGAFKTAWASAMHRQGLRNAEGRDGWYEGDAFHLELPESRIALTDVRAQACMEEYVRLTRQEGRSRNDRFERSYAAELKPFVEEFERRTARR